MILFLWIISCHSFKHLKEHVIFLSYDHIIFRSYPKNNILDHDMIHKIMILISDPYSIFDPRKIIGTNELLDHDYYVKMDNYVINNQIFNLINMIHN